MENVGPWLRLGAAWPASGLGWAVFQAALEAPGMTPAMEKTGLQSAWVLGSGFWFMAPAFIWVAWFPCCADAGAAPRAGGHRRRGPKDPGSRQGPWEPPRPQPASRPG